MIIWNKVTWYSKLAAAVLFIVGLPILTFYIGMQYQATLTIVKESHNTPMMESENKPIFNKASDQIVSADDRVSEITDSLDVKTYRSTKCGFEFKYPVYATFIEGPDESSCEYLKIFLKGKSPTGNYFELQLYGQPIILSKGGSPDVVYDTLDEIEQYLIDYEISDAPLRISSKILTYTCSATSVPYAENRYCFYIEPTPGMPIEFDLGIDEENSKYISDQVIESIQFFEPTTNG
jgi:hypothetical protein